MNEEQIAAKFNEWIGQDLILNDQQIKHIAWAMAMDRDLRIGVEKLVDAEH